MQGCNRALQPEPNARSLHAELNGRCLYHGAGATLGLGSGQQLQVTAGLVTLFHSVTSLPTIQFIFLRFGVYCCWVLGETR